MSYVCVGKSMLSWDVLSYVCRTWMRQESNDIVEVVTPKLQGEFMKGEVQRLYNSNRKVQ